MFNAQAAKNSPLNSRIAAAHRTATLIVMVVAFSIGVYMAIGLILIGSGKAAAAAFDYQMYFLVAAALLAILSIGLRRAQFGKLRLESVGKAYGTPGLLRHFTLTTIVAVAIAELIGLLALVVIFFGGTQRDVLLLGVVALFVVGSGYPRLAAWQRVIRYFDSISYQDSEPDSERK